MTNVFERLYEINLGRFPLGNNLLRNWDFRDVDIDCVFFTRVFLELFVLFYSIT
jgi:hypothetical protein